ncbi:hypothetical protein GCM10010486_18840 [Nonomuraea roseoviolacea subsp. carminata]
MRSARFSSDAAIRPTVGHNARGLSSGPAEVFRTRSTRARAAVSGLARLDQGRLRQAMGRLADDLAAGRRHERHRDLLDADALDVGYRLVAAG